MEPTIPVGGSGRLSARVELLTGYIQVSSFFKLFVQPFLNKTIKNFFIFLPFPRTISSNICKNTMPRAYRVNKFVAHTSWNSCKVGSATWSTKKKDTRSKCAWRNPARAMFKRNKLTMRRCQCDFLFAKMDLSIDNYPLIQGSIL